MRKNVTPSRVCRHDALLAYRGPSAKKSHPTDIVTVWYQHILMAQTRCLVQPKRKAQRDVWVLPLVLRTSKHASVRCVVPADHRRTIVAVCSYETCWSHCTGGQRDCIRQLLMCLLLLLLLLLRYQKGVVRSKRVREWERTAKYRGRVQDFATANPEITSPPGVGRTAHISLPDCDESPVCCTYTNTFGAIWQTSWLDVHERRTVTQPLGNRADSQSDRQQQPYLSRNTPFRSSFERCFGTSVWETLCLLPVGIAHTASWVSWAVMTQKYTT